MLLLKYFQKIKVCIYVNYFLYLEFFSQIPLASKPQMDALRGSHRGDHSSHCCNCGIRQDLSKAMDEIARLRTEMKEQREKHELEMS